MLQIFEKIPISLYRIQSGYNIKIMLREFEAQRKQKRTSYDVKLEEGFVLPRSLHSSPPATNGLSLLTHSNTLKDVIKTWKRKDKAILRLDQGLSLPHFSLKRINRNNLIYFIFFEFF